ncbi:LCCL domain containing protein, related [Neospora caninum Liverpool]|uniref:LCCL domain containing protein, related n=1 Tax=Neospora caninum (strain Liverpool) TaxID=572307 RepID=F0VK48_NEOCL|nr:LCCL domain containing protein, related [Neospora caninum Liverpool]CBZ54449.1 LCCL domain containing protein, related [Neospora caninum Liverpool]|eukprot:XP_003884479.1 LCCL domain containing protein, related [Neospora caninum Liverpool]
MTALQHPQKARNLLLTVRSNQAQVTGAVLVALRTMNKELWYSTPQMQLVSARSNPPKCMTLQDGSTEGKASKVVSVRIQWEYPALSYEIYTSPDGKSYIQQAVNPANPAADTLDELHAAVAQFIQIRMLKPHPRLGKADDSFVYGIYEVHVYANRLGIMPQCSPAPLRVYCDMTTGSSIYVWNGTPVRKPGATLDDVVSLDDVRNSCARVGLEPMVPKSPQHFKSILTALYQMDDTKLPVYGSDGVYSATSSICRAAIHAGLIKTGGVVNVSIESPRASYEGSVQNGIVSSALEASPGSRAIASIRLGTIFKAKEEAGMAIGASRKQLKPAEKLHRAQTAQVLEMFVGTESLAARWLTEAGNMFQMLDQLNQKLQIVEQQHLEQTGFESFKLYPQSMAFKDYFETFDSVRAKHGPSNWGYATAPIQGRKASIGQSRNIVGTSETEGTYAMLRGRRFYDADIQISFYAAGSGSVGIAFKMRDLNNMYLLWMNQQQAVKRLFRIENGQPTVLAERKDGGYIQGKWFNVRIETNKGVISVCIGEEGSTEVEVFSVLDERFMVGSVGFFSSGMEAGVFFEGLKIEAKECGTPSKATAPAPPRCSTFTDTFYGNPNSIYRKIDASDATGAEGSWVYKVVEDEYVSSRNQNIASTSSGEHWWQKQSVGPGKNGYFVFEFFPQCTGGIVGGIFRFNSPQEYQVAELAPNELRIRAISNGQPKTVARTPASMGLNKWHRMEINFEGSTVSVRLEGPGGSVTHLSAEDFFGGQTRDGMVGFSAYNCGGVAFDSIQLSPYKLESIAPTESVFTSISATKAWQPCLASVHILHRRDECQRMFEREPTFRQIACAQDFCSECCNYNTSLLPRSEWEQCEKNCRRNDPLASHLEKGLVTRLGTCLTNLGDAASHCEKGILACQKEACELCCMSWSRTGGLDHIGADLQRDVTEREQKECKFQCARHLVSHENQELYMHVVDIIVLGNREWHGVLVNVRAQHVCIPQWGLGMSLFFYLFRNVPAFYRRLELSQP